MSSHNKELRQQRIQEMELATPKIIFENPKVAIGPDRDIDQFAATFLSKKKQKNRGKKRVWNNRYNLRIAYQHIQDWKTHYFALDSQKESLLRLDTDLPLNERKRKITFCL
jgi:uncharacterized protein YcbX